MDTYWKLISKAIKSDNLEELQYILTGYTNVTIKFHRENNVKLHENQNMDFHSKDMCYISMCLIVNEYYEKEGTTLLHIAVSQYSPGAVRLLLQYGTDPNTYNKSGESALLVALLLLGQSRGNSSNNACKLKHIVKLLMDFDADLYNLTPKGISFLHISVRNEYVIFKELFEIMSKNTCRSFNINYQLPATFINPYIESDKDYSAGDTALHMLAKTDYASDISKELLKCGLNPNIRNMSGYTALHYSASKQSVELLPILLEAGSDPNIQITSSNKCCLHLLGSTYLHIVFQTLFPCNQFNLRYIKLLLQHGGNLDILDSEHNSPMLYYYKMLPYTRYINLEQMGYVMDIFKMLMSGGAVTRRALKEVSSFHKKLQRRFEYIILTYYTHTWLFITLVDVRYPFLYLKTTPEHYQFYSIPQSLERLSAMVLYSSLKPNVWCGIKQIDIPKSLRYYVTLGDMDILFSSEACANYSGKHWQRDENYSDDDDDDDQYDFANLDYDDDDDDYREEVDLNSMIMMDYGDDDDDLFEVNDYGWSWHNDDQYD